MTGSRTRLAATIPVAAALLAGCGGARHPRRRAGAEPAVAPALAGPPAGHVVRVGAQAEGIVADAPARHLQLGGPSTLLVPEAPINRLRTARPRLHPLSRLALPGTAYGIASDPMRRRQWATETATNTVAELDTSRPRPRVIATFPTVRQPNTVAVDTSSGRVFVAGAAAGDVQFFDPAHVHSLR